ncbi:LPS translocon maturation chaperone LptM [Zhongshania arctica]|uniref:Lipoprotein n=1 Tax=Zhongshania arctica TaxID=3238302 RepID=A0ABV3TS11_9GAMM
MVNIRIFALCSAVLLGACGQTGPLILAEDDGTKANEDSSSANIATSPKPRQQTNTNTATTSPAE